MTRRNMLGLSVITALGLALLPGNASAQQKSVKDQLAGAWSLVSNTTTRSDGTKVDTFGSNAKATAIYEANGRFVTITMRSDLPKFASNNRTTGTADENKAVVQGSIAYFGTYSVDEADKSFTAQVEGSTFPNWTGTAQKRKVTFSGNEMTQSLTTGSAGGSVEIKWKRVSAAAIN
jgi:lipocalin-like protein